MNYKTDITKSHQSYIFRLYIGQRALRVRRKINHKPPNIEGH